MVNPASSQCLSALGGFLCLVGNLHKLQAHRRLCLLSCTAKLLPVLPGAQVKKLREGSSVALRPPQLGLGHIWALAQPGAVHIWGGAEP